VETVRRTRRASAANVRERGRRSTGSAGARSAPPTRRHWRERRSSARAAGVRRATLKVRTASGAARDAGPVDLTMQSAL
jgi:hypothetical protein